MGSDAPGAGTRVVIVGAGPAGMRAAMVLADAGLRPAVIDEAAQGGGQIYRRPPGGFARSPETLYGTEAGKARALHAGFDALGGRIEHWPESLVWSLADGAAHVMRGGASHRIPYDRLLLATGAMDRVIPLPGWTTPGVYTLGAAQVALKAQGCGIGRRVAFVGSSPILALVASQYAAAGATVAAVLDTAPLGAKLRAAPRLLAHATGRKGIALVAGLAARGIRYRHGVTPVAVLGEGTVAGLAWTDAGGRRHETECDAVALGYGLASESQLADLAGCAFAFDAAGHGWRVEQDGMGRSTVEGVYLAGDGARIGGADLAELTGERAARAILLDLGDGAQARELDRLAHAIAGHGPLRAALDAAFPFPARLARAVPDDCVLCRCEAVTAGEYRAAIAGLSAHEVNRAKAFSRVGMGRCQGRVCGPAAAVIAAAQIGCTVEQAGRLRAQPPVKPVPIGLAPAEASDEAAA